MFTLAQYAPQMQIPDAGNAPSARQQPYPQRRTVVPIEMIKEYSLEPTRGGGYALLGEDGRYYNLDDVLAIIIRLHLEERRGPQMKK